MFFCFKLNYMFILLLCTEYDSWFPSQAPEQKGYCEMCFETEYAELAKVLRDSFRKHVKPYVDELKSLNAAKTNEFHADRQERVNWLNKQVRRIRIEHEKRLNDAYEAEARKVVQLIFRRREQGTLGEADDIMNMIWADGKLWNIYKKGTCQTNVYRLTKKKGN